MIAAVAEAQGLSQSQWRYGWTKCDDASIFVVNPAYGQHQYGQALDAALERIKKAAPKFPKIKRTKIKEDDCALVLNLTDWHFGAWSEKEATELANDVVSTSLQRARGFALKHFIVVVGNDLLHVDNVHYSTTKGTPQVTDGSTWHQAYTAACRCYEGILERLIPLGTTEACLCSGNHDQLTSFTLAQHLQAYFRHTDATWQVSAKKRKYTRWGNSFIGFTHGDKVKTNELPMLAAQEAPQLWAETQHRHMYLGHVHHAVGLKFELQKAHPGMEIEWLTSPKPTDDWHDENGYIGSRGATTFIHSLSGGQEARYRINL
jgi:hypothetical protein